MANKYGIPEGKKRVALTLPDEEVEILQEVAKKYRRTVSSMISYMIDTNLKYELEKYSK